MYDWIENSPANIPLKQVFFSSNFPAGQGKGRANLTKIKPRSCQVGIVCFDAGGCAVRVLAREALGYLGLVGKRVTVGSGLVGCRSMAIPSK